MDVQLPGKALRLGGRAARHGGRYTRHGSVPKAAPLNGYIVTGPIGVAIVDLLCSYSIDRAAIQDRRRQTVSTIKLGNVVDSKLVIKGAPDSKLRTVIHTRLMQRESGFVFRAVGRTHNS